MAVYTIGVGVAVATAFTPSTPAIIGLLVRGTLIIGITYLTSRILYCIAPMRHDMKNNAFHHEKLKKNGKLLGELYYDGQVPILKIDSDDPYEADIYQPGYLLVVLESCGYH
jgi:hypothetical protein